ncbi:fimbrial protein [Frateuria hangzhouensis]|uniref:fimbrial protein n=1 Tax=Frateuria hangzhouensis TaxID=2995589 RepID=UPI002260FAF8|nr:fimbrial protein [Frateuria sp. STR12]MCX7512607.1 fimbrial protein [Frateuria sp. STR12]
MKQFFAFVGRRPAIVLCLLALLAWIPAAHAKTQPCSINGMNEGAVITIPFGSVAFSYGTYGPVGPVLNQTVLIHCPQSVFSGSADKSRMVIQGQMHGGTYDAGTNTWMVPTGDPNLDVQIRLVWSFPSSEPIDEGGDRYEFASLSKWQTDWFANFSIQLVKKVGNVDPGNISATLVDLLNTKDGNQSEAATIATVKIGAGTTIRSLSCVANSVTVQLPTVTTQDLASAGPYTGVAPTPIPIDVSGCEPGTQLSIALTGTPPAGMPASSGVVQSTGTEPNVAVQILNNDTTFNTTDISGNSRRYIGRVPSGGGTLSTVYYARYYALQPAQGGRVKAGLTFTLTYP